MMRDIIKIMQLASVVHLAALATELSGDAQE
jgi:hypothetical protein